MDYFSKFLRPTTRSLASGPVDHEQEFHCSWNLIKSTLMQPDERQLTKGITSTDVPAHLQSLVDSLVWESTRTEEGGTGACLEYILKNDVLGTLVRLSEQDRPSGIQAQVLRAVQNMVVMMDEQFLVHSAVHRAVLRLLRNCVGDDLQEQLDNRTKTMGAARNAVRSRPSEHEEDLVDLLRILCSRIRTYHELLMIFFHDKHWYRAEPLFSADERDGDEEDEEDEEDEDEYRADSTSDPRPLSPTPSQTTIKHDHATSSTPKKPEYEFLLFNYLLRFVHREGKIGESARAGLLFLMDVAMSPVDSKDALRPVNFSADASPASDKPSSTPVNDSALALAEYILDGDFSEVLGAGLAAVYSLLPSKLGFFPPVLIEATSGTRMTIGGTLIENEEDQEQLELDREKSRALGIEDASHPEFKSQLDNFLRLLEFLQDLCKRRDAYDNETSSSSFRAAIIQSVLDAVRQIFLENVLYPSILECSDTDGSSVAVISYIEIMIRTLHEGPLSVLLVNFLVEEDSDDSWRRLKSHTITLSPDLKAPRKEKCLKRRKSSAMVLLELEAPESRKQSEYITSIGRFTLKDLLLENLRSSSQASATSALQLLQTILLKYPQLCLEHVIRVIPDPNATSFPHPAVVNNGSIHQLKEQSFNDDDSDEEDFQYPTGIDYISPPLHADGPSSYQPITTYSTHEREMGLYLSLVSRVDPSHNADIFSTGYDHYLRDALRSVQGQPVYYDALANTGSSIDDRRNLKHRLNVNDVVLSLILETTQRFFMNTPEFNMALTGVLATLSLHPDRSLSGWLTLGPGPSLTSCESEESNMVDEDGDDRSIDFEIEERLTHESVFLPAASMDDSNRPVLYSIFHGLITQLERYRHMVDDFDKYLLERRKGLLFSENLTDALNLVLDITEEPSTVKAVVEVASKPNTKPKVSAPSALMSFLTPRKNKTSKVGGIPAESSTLVRSVKENKSVSASPFGTHYQHTGSVTVEALLAPIPETGLWSPAKSMRWNVEDDVFSSSRWSDDVDDPFIDGGQDIQAERERRPDKVGRVTLSQLLDNVVILEESIKELAAIIHARRSLGIDSLRYL